MQSPLVQLVIEHDAVFVHVAWQSPPGHAAEQEPPLAHEYMQSPLPGHACVHCVPAGHAQT
jgi:hypothetical protein